MLDRVTSPDDPALDALCEALKLLSPKADQSGEWPAEALRLFGESGVYEWFVKPHHGGQGWNEEAITRGYLTLSEAFLSATFILTQRVGACRRIEASKNDALKSILLPDLVSGKAFATVGISHLTTSRRHLGRPILTAERADGGYLLNGYAPWVTGAERAEHVVVGAVLVEEGEPTNLELLVAAPTDAKGVRTPEPFSMVSLTSSRTGPIELDHVFVPDELVVGGPTEEVMKTGVGARPGGPQTSALAMGSARAAIRLLEAEAERRPDLVEACEALLEEYAEVLEDLMAAARGTPSCSGESLRQRANSLVLRASQAALTATKGAGYLAEAPAGRYCREALFFLVWSCPAPVQNANLCELAGLAV